MVTGDHPATARAIAGEVGLLTPEGRVLEGHDLPADDALLGALVDHDGMVLSRVTPEDKLRIARALRTRGHVVAMTGDGVNDGPALQEASIGVAMGRSGTDVAREAADLVLLDDNFATIVAAVKQGRVTFSNARRFLTYHLTDNVAEVAPFVIWALSGGTFPLALSVLQVLSLDIGTDILPALTLATEPPTARILERPPRGRHLLDRSVLVRAFWPLGTGGSIRRNGSIHSRNGSGWLAAGRGISGRPALPRRIGCRVLGSRSGADGECICLPKLNALAGRFGLDDESPPSLCSSRRVGDARHGSLSRPARHDSRTRTSERTGSGYCRSRVPGGISCRFPL